MDKTLKSAYVLMGGCKSPISFTKNQCILIKLYRKTSLMLWYIINNSHKDISYIELEKCSIHFSRVSWPTPPVTNPYSFFVRKMRLRLLRHMKIQTVQPIHVNCQNLTAFLGANLTFFRKLWMI